MTITAAEKELRELVKKFPTNMFLLHHGMRTAGPAWRKNEYICQLAKILDQQGTIVLRRTILDSDPEDDDDTWYNKLGELVGTGDDFEIAAWMNKTGHRPDHILQKWLDNTPKGDMVPEVTYVQILGMTRYLYDRYLEESGTLYNRTGN